MKYYVYTLAHNGTVFYVGKGCGPRIKQHEQEALGGHACPKCDIIRAIWRDGGSVQRIIVFETDDEQEALDYEAELIGAYGYNQLVNQRRRGARSVPRRRVKRVERVLLPKVNADCAFLVDQLFKTYRRPDGKEYSYQEVAAASEGLLDATLIGKLRSGKTKNPSRTTILGLCRFFQVPASYFFPDVEAVLPEGSTPASDLDEILSALGVPPDLVVHLRAVIAAFVNAP